MENKIELKPCPFCGYPAELRHFSIMTSTAIHCTNDETVCGAWVKDNFEITEEAGITDVIKRWNTRA